MLGGPGIGGPSAHSDILSTSPPDTLSSRNALIEEIKRRGRLCVVNKHYPDADALYGKGIEILSSPIDGGDENADKKDTAILYSNRSLVRMSMGKITEALEDADAAVTNDPTYVKAHWRRGQASNACGNTSEAIIAFEKALELDPTNKALMKEVKSAKEKKEMEEKLLKEAKESADNDDAAADDDDGGSSEKKDVILKDARKETVKKPQTTSSQSTSQSTSAVKETDPSLFTKSDHVRGYKIRSDGKKTSYFDREIDDEAKKLIGDIAPKKLDAASGGGESSNDFAPKPVAVVEGTSAWNKAGKFSFVFDI